MKGPRCLLFFLLLNTLAVFFVLQGCLQDYLPRQVKEKEEREIIVSEEREPLPPLAEEFPEGMLYPLVFFQEKRSNHLIPVTLTLPWTEGVGRAALEKLIEGPVPAQEMRFGLSSPVPPTTRVRGLTIRDGLAKLDLSNSFLNYDPREERAVLNSIIFTLLQFPTVEKVQILVEGAALEKFPGGTPGKKFFGREQGLNLEASGAVIPVEESQVVTLYFCTLLGDNHIFYVPVSRLIQGQEDIIKGTMAELLKGPSPRSFLFSELPPGTTWRRLELEGDTLVIDLSRELLNYKGGLRGEKNIYAQLALTFTEIPGVKKVQVLVEGEKVILKYGMSFQEPLLRPFPLNPLEPL